MVCCTGVSNDCTPVDQAADCCKTAPQVPLQFVSVEKTKLRPYELTSMALDSAVVALVLPGSFDPRIFPSPPPGSKQPTYLRLSVLRL